MNKAIVFILVAIVAVTVMISSNDGGSVNVAKSINQESIRGDITEIAGKGLYYKNKYGDYPAYPENIYDMKESEIHQATAVFERFFDKAYIEKNIKLVDAGELKDKGITYELANKDKKYFIDVLTGQVLSPDLIESDEDYAKDVTAPGGFKVAGTVTIIDGDGKAMNPVNGSVNSGNKIYFYGGGDMKLARRDEITREITNLDATTLGLADTLEILYIQPSQSGKTLKAALLKADGVHIQDITLN